jgi:hypothetical protein
MTRSLVAGSIAMLLIGSANVALADPPPRDDPRYAQRSERAAQQREDVRRFDPRVYEAREEQRRQQVDNHPDRRGGRLSPDERRDLRRQINEAGMDIYPNTPRR